MDWTEEQLKDKLLSLGVVVRHKCSRKKLEEERLSRLREYGLNSHEEEKASEDEPAEMAKGQLLQEAKTLLTQQG